MITVSISGRKATLLKTADLPTGNDNSIKVNFIFSASDPVWKGATKVAIFVAITPRGLRKTLPAVIDSDGECFIPGKILSTPFSKISVGAMATYEGGSSVASNLVFVNSTDAGAGGDNIYDEEELPIDKNDFEIFMAELAASIGVQVNELNEKIENLNPLAEDLEINEDGKLEVNDREVMDFVSYFHYMSRYSGTFSVPTYWDLLEYDDSYSKGVDEKSGLPITWIKKIDLRPGTKNGDHAIVKNACGNSLRPHQVEELSFIPQANVVYPVIHFWNFGLPVPESDEENTYAYASFQTFDGKEYVINRYFDTNYVTWVVALDVPDIEGTFYYALEEPKTLDADNCPLEVGTYVLIGNDGKKVDRKDWPEFWPIARDVMCTHITYPEKFKGIMFNHDPRNDHPRGHYEYSSARQRWVLIKNSPQSFDVTIKKDSWSWENRKTLMIRGVCPLDLVSVGRKCGYGDFSVVDIGYGHITVEAPKTITEDITLSLFIENTIDRCDTYGLWSEW